MERFWSEKPSHLLNQEYIYNIWPNAKQSLEEKMNASTRLVILVSVLGYFFLKNQNLLVIGLLTIMLLWVVYKIQVKTQWKLNQLTEGFATLSPAIYEQTKTKQTMTTPTQANPLMNVLPNEGVDNPKRPAAAPSFHQPVQNDIQQSVKASLDPKLFMDLGDDIELSNSMRNFHTMPNTSIPNDQKAFAEFCYGNMTSCKEGDAIQCNKHNIRHINL